MSVTIKQKNNIMTAQIKGEIDHHTVPAIRDAIDDAFVCAENITELVIDFSEVTFMDSSGIGLVMGRYKLASANSKALRVVNLSERDYKIMKMSGIEKLAKVSKKGELK